MSNIPVNIHRIAYATPPVDCGVIFTPKKPKNDLIICIRECRTIRKTDRGSCSSLLALANFSSLRTIVSIPHGSLNLCGLLDRFDM